MLLLGITATAGLRKIEGPPPKAAPHHFALILFICCLLPGLAAHASDVNGTGFPDLADLSLEELTRIEVTSVSKKAEPLNHAPAAIYVITGEDIRRSGVTSIPEALRLAPGLQVARLDAHNWAISARGFNDVFANKLLVLIDGRSVYTPLFAGVYWDVQDLLLEDVEKIEIIRGPGATLWGANAVNGVINITTKSSFATQGALVVAGYGSEEGFGALRHGGRFGEHGSYRLYTKYRHHDKSALPSGRDANDSWEALRSGFRTDWEPSAQNLFTVQGDIYQNREHQTYNLLVPAFPFSRDDNDILKLSGGNVLGRWTHHFSDESDLRLQTYYDRTQRRNGFFNEERDTADIELQYRLPLFKRQDLVVGAGYRYSDSANLKSNFTLSFGPAERQTHIFNAFIQDRITLVEERLFLTLGSKLEHNDYTHWEFQPGGRLLWTPKDDHAVWASVSRAVRTPARSDRDMRLVAAVLPPLSAENPAPFPGIVTVDGNDDFHSEVLLAYEVGYRVQPWTAVSFDLALFYNDYDRLTSFEPRAEDLSNVPSYIRYPLFFANDLEGEIYGGELAADWHVADWWLLRGSYSYLQIQLHQPAGSLDITLDDDERAGPHHQFVLRSLADLPHNLQLDVGLRYVDSLPAKGIASYVGLDMRLGWRPWQHLDFSIVGQNLIEARHAEFSPSIIREQQTQVQRAVYGKVTWTF
jgi:iron complex outermembrane recepter protein